MDKYTENDESLRRRKKKKNNFFRRFIFLLLFAMACSGGTYAFLQWLPNYNTESLYKIYTNWNEDEISIVVRDKPIRNKKAPVFENDMIYLPVEFLEEYIDPSIFWDNSVKKLTITTFDKVIRMKTDELNYYVNHNPATLNLPIYDYDGSAFVPIDILQQLYNIKIDYHPSSRIVTVDFHNEERFTAEITAKKANMRYEPNKKSPIAKKMIRGDLVTVYEQENNYVKIRTADGIIGYIPFKQIGETEKAAVVYEEPAVISPPFMPENGKINAVWDLLTNANANAQPSKRIFHDGLDVLSPTWFKIANSEGELLNIADQGYVNWAHQNGYQVWALFSNNFDDRNFKTFTHEVLKNTDKRDKVIKQILSFAALYNLDGINIDFEDIPKEDGEYFVQFVREITPFLREQGLTVSVDVYVPYPHTEHYKRGELAKVVDYLVIMGYDEHWATSPTSGSVASIGWVENGVKNTIAQGVDSEKIILGIPFYTRVWRETFTNGAIKVSSQAVSMQRGYDILVENNAEILWDDSTGQYYGEYKKDGDTYKIWVEDERSIGLKLDLVEKYNLAGVAGWRRGLEKESIWQVLRNKLKS